MHPLRRTAVLAALALGVYASRAQASPDMGRARDAYDRGVRAHAAADYTTAAKAFAEADALAPTTASLEAALEAAMRADDAALGAELLDRANRRTERDAPLAKTIDAAKDRFAGRTGTIHVECTGTERCLVAVDGRASDGSRPLFAVVGTHTVVVQRGDLRAERLVEVRPDTVAWVTAPTAAPWTDASRSEAPRTTRPASSGLSPTWFFVGLGATVLAGAGTVVSGLDAASKHDDFVAGGCAVGATGTKDAHCNARSGAGSSATLRTNLLLGATAFFAVSTTALGIVFVRWSPSPSPSASRPANMFVGGVVSAGATF